jgi:hypothetical protein
MERTPILYAPRISIVERMRAIVPDVEGIILHQVEANSVSEYLLKQGSIAQQQNLLLGETLEKVEQQTTLTNGRVTVGEQERHAIRARLFECEKVLDAYKAATERWRRRVTWIMTIVGPIVTAVVMAVLKKMGWL